MALAAIFGAVIDPHIAAATGAVLLLTIGLFSLFQEYLIRRITPCDPYTSQKLTIRIGKLLINIMADPEAVDFDHSKSINTGESVMLGLALGLDNMAATFAASLLGILPIYTPAVMGIFQMALIGLGVHIGARYVPDRLSAKFPYFPGVLLVFMGITRLVK
jgi:putative sporulation protein YtaF